MLWEAIVLGVIQGLTEFLPISSSAHLTVLPQMFHWETPWLNSLSFDVALHLGTFLALMGYFWKDVWMLGRAWLTKGWTMQGFQDPQAKLAWWVILATIPAVAIALPFENKIETIFREPALIAVCLIGAGLVLGWAEYVSRKQKTQAGMTLGHALVIGCAQILALIPGVSRSGITITAGLFAGFNRETAARFSFLLAIPITGGACLHKFKDLLQLSPGPETTATLAGIVTSAVVGWLCIHFLLAYLRQSSLYIFVIYRICFGAAILSWVFLK
jgi:undecaprenyl-diphosphatase